MSKIFLTSDLHIGHSKEFLWKPRGYKNCFEHDKDLIRKWNKAVTDDDIVYILGDIMLEDNEYGKVIFNQLNGFKYIIVGNHDTETRQSFYEELRGVLSVKYADILKYGKYRFFLCHFPSYVKSFDKSSKLFCLHGHTHNKDRFEFINQCCYNVNLDAHNMEPIEISKIVEDIKAKKELL